jgi:hypothetical protein
MPNQKPTALFVMSAAKGHLNASFGLARQVAASGYSVVYAAPLQMHQYVGQQGFSSVSLEGLPFGVNGEKALDDMAQAQRVKYFDGLIDRFYDKIYTARKEAIERLMAQTKPSLVFLDSFQSADFILIYPLLQKHNIQFMFIQIMLSFHQQPNNLPLDCAIVPDANTHFMWHWRRHYVKRWFRFAWDTVIYFGKSNRRVVAQKAKNVGIGSGIKSEAIAPGDGFAKTCIDYDQCFRIGFTNVPELLIAPQGLEFTTQKQPYQHYLGLMVDVERVEVVNESVSVLLTNLPADRKLIYCSLGSFLKIYLHQPLNYLTVSLLLVCQTHLERSFLVCRSTFTFLIIYPKLRY